MNTERKLKFHEKLAIVALGVYAPTLIKKINKGVNKAKKERELTRRYKVEIEQGFFTNKIKYVEREKPLTDEELDQLLNTKL
jgi:dTDP-glucose pyrophosphorylase